MVVKEAKTTVGTLTMDGDTVTFSDGETLYQVAERNRKDIPTLCYDPRLEAFGACRLCVVEVEGSRLPVASCTTPAAPGMVVKTTTDQIDKHRKVLLEMVLSENGDHEVDPLRGYASQELCDLANRYSARRDRFRGSTSGETKDDENPFLLRDYDKCISCYRCVRVCAEQEGDYAISVMNRGFHTQITTEFDGVLKESACTFCGQCVQTCPTGALGDKKALRAEEMTEPVEKTRSICAYCGVGCSVDIMTRGEKIVGIQPAMDGPANLGALCVKGQFAFDFVQHRDRLEVPLVKDENGEFQETTWDDALDRAAAGFMKAKEEHGRYSVYGVASGRAPSEAAYLMQKFIRAGFGTHQIDNCSRA
jgi:NADH-quinone oxidoreductase subunit G